MQTKNYSANRNNNEVIKEKSAIAVIGIGCHYPGAQSPLELWENVLGRRQEFRRFLDIRLPVAEYFDADPNTPDKIYAQRAAYIDGFDFDWAGHRIPKKTFEGTDIVQWLTLETALQALRDAGYDKDSVPRSKTGVILGNSLTGEQTRANNMRLRWPFVKKAMRKSAQAMGLTLQLQEQFLTVSEEIYKSVFPPVDEDTLQGGLSNTIAGRVSNYFDLHGGGYVVDGACSSSLLAVCTAAGQLADGDLDMALAGGVDISLDTFELIGFAKTSALAAEDMHVYDKRGKGFIPGEGCGFVVLKRLLDAQRDGNDIYAVIKGWGISSDGKGGITAPSSDGQATALLRAYDRADYSSLDLDFIEGHGTGTARGDKTELEGIAKAMAVHGKVRPRQCGITSLKSIMGHTKAAAGIGAFIKATIATNRRVLPPTAGCSQPNPIFESSAKGLYPILQGSVFDPSYKVRAGVSAMGFGGINSHVTLESYSELPLEKLTPGVAERSLVVSAQDSELFVYSAESVEAMLSKLSHSRDIVVDISLGDITDYSCDLTNRISPDDKIRAAAIASNPMELVARLDKLIKIFQQEPIKDGNYWVSPRQDAWAANAAPNAKQKDIRVGFLFPGQGSQRLGVGRTLCERFAWARDIVSLADRIADEELGYKLSPLLFPPLDRVADEQQLQSWKDALSDTQVAQPVICLCSLLYLKFLQKLGIAPSVVAGHSLGELTAFHAAGAFDEETLLRMAMVRGKAMGETGKNRGAMASINAAKEQVVAMLKQVSGYITLANINASEQMVVSGNSDSIEQLLKLASNAGINAQKLPVSGAFHSTLMEDSARRVYKSIPVSGNLGDLNCDLLSTTSGTRVESKTDLRKHFSEQITSQVNFVATAHNLLRDTDLLLEVGCGQVLSGLIDNIADRQGRCLPTGVKADVTRSVNIILATVFVNGIDVQWSCLHEGRLVRAFRPLDTRKFIENPCERALADVEVQPSILPQLRPSTWVNGAMGRHLGKHHFSAQEIDQYFNERGEFIATVINADMCARSVAPSLQCVNQAPVLSPVEPEPQMVVEETTAVSMQLMLSHVARATGFSENAILPELRLLDDLNLDSIKAGQLVGHIARDAGVVGEIDAAVYANATIQEIYEAVTKISTAKQSAQNHRTGEQGTSGLTFEKIRNSLVEVVVETTGYAKDSIKLEYSLLDDLNLDSIKAGQLIGRVARLAGVADKVDSAELGNSTLGDIVTAVLAAQQSSATPLRSATAKPNDMMEIDTVRSFLLQTVSESTGYPIGSIPLESRLLDDLNLDSIKAGQLVGAVARQANVAGKIEANEFVNASLNDIALAIQSLSRHQPGSDKPVVPLTATNKKPLATSSAVISPGVDFESAQSEQQWVRNFVVDYRPQTLLFSAKTTDYLVNENILLLTDPSQLGLSSKIKSAFVAAAGQVLEMSYGAFSAEKITQQHVKAKRPITKVVGVLPVNIATDHNQFSNLKQSVARLHTILDACLALGVADMTFVQFGGGYFGESDRVHIANACSAAGFARSVSLERANFSIRVIDLSTALEPEVMATHIANEVGMKGNFHAVGYNRDNIRVIPKAKLQQSALNTPRDIQWGENDVILVTGGGKGITAECALALAQETGARFALVGSSALPLPQDNKNEIAQTLNRFEALGNIYAYYSCNLSRQAEVIELLERIRAELGSITGVIHGAGINQARGAEQVSVDQAMDEISPKVLGIRYILDALVSVPPKMVVGFSSIIGVTGMMGNAWYAYSNESLNFILREFEAANPNSSVISIAYSVWGEVGMGQRMGVIENLGSMGVGAVPTHKGVSCFLDLIANNPGYKQVIVAGSLAGLPTWHNLVEDLPIPKNLRFIEEITHYELGAKLVARADLTLKKDLYLKDHNFRGSYLFPTVFGLEAMTQVASVLTGKHGEEVVSIEAIDLSRPIVVDETVGETIELRAFAEEADSQGRLPVRVDIFCAQSGYNTVHFSAVIVFGDKVAMPTCMVQAAYPLMIEPKRDLYGDYLFQGALFQQMEHVYAISEAEVVFSCVCRNPVPAGENGFSHGSVGSNLLLGDAFYRDVLLQSVQLPATPDIVLPISIGRIELFGDSQLRSGHKIICASLKQTVGRDYTWDVVVTDGQGNVSERLLDYRVRTVNDPSRKSKPSIEELLSRLNNGALQNEKALNNAVNTVLENTLFEGPAISVSMYKDLGRLPLSKRREVEIPMLRRAKSMWFDIDVNSGEIDVELVCQDNGKPRFKKPLSRDVDLSIAHDNSYCLCTVGRFPQGCDIEQVDCRDIQAWTDLISLKRQTVFSELQTIDGCVDRAGTRLWCAMESAAKVYGTWHFDMAIHSVSESAIVFTIQHQSRPPLFVLTLPVYLLDAKQRIISVTVREQLATTQADSRQADLLAKGRVYAA